MDFRPTASLQTLQQRAALLASVREFFTEHGYWECETPTLSRDVVVDANLDPIETTVCGGRMFLQTSPEAGMKRLLAAGADAIFQITRAFRQDERGSLHNPEFTMIEWYRVGDSYHDQMEFTEGLVRHVYSVARNLTGFNPLSDLRQPSDAFARLSYDEAFEKSVGQRVQGLNSDSLRMMAASAGVSIPESLDPQDRDGWLNLLLSELVEPQIANQGAVFVYDYPASQCALARVRNDSPPVAERFELYHEGVELCNGYQELTDSSELERRARIEGNLKSSQRACSLPGASMLTAAMKHGLPDCSGVALGFDRLAMIALGKERLDDVLAFPFDRA